MKHPQNKSTLHYAVRFDNHIHIRVFGHDLWIDPRDINWKDLQKIMDTPEPFIMSHTRGYVYPNPNDALLQYMLECDQIEIQPDFDITETPDADYVQGPLTREDIAVLKLSGGNNTFIGHHCGVIEEPLK